MRTAVSLSAIALACVALTPVGAQAAQDPTPGPAVTMPTDPDGIGGHATETISYGKHRRQQMDVWWTPDGMQRPGVFIVHGGWWSSGDKRGMTQIARSYADMGYTVFNINYRLSTQAAWPAQRTDALAAIAAARRHADRWAFDANNYVVVGFSMRRPHRRRRRHLRQRHAGAEGRGRAVADHLPAARLHRRGRGHPAQQGTAAQGGGPAGRAAATPRASARGCGPAWRSPGTPAARTRRCSPCTPRTSSCRRSRASWSRTLSASSACP
ncbi:alpha/beta hydrolase fold domain-containing protein [Nonomuraea ferruginea]